MKHRQIQRILTVGLLCILTSISWALQPLRTQLSGSELATLRLRYAPESADYNGQLLRPYLELGNEDKILEISFDQLSHETHFYSYTLLHLNADGTRDELPEYEYLQGSNSVDINDYEHSLNTQQDYTHYRFLFPNEDMRPTISGNYAIQIYEDGKREQVVATVCFQVVEQKTRIEINQRANTDIEFSGRYQQLDIDLDLQKEKVLSPDEIRLVVEQNGRIDNRVFAPKPSLVEPQHLRWIHSRELIFEGGNEYQHFDDASLYFMGQNVDQMSYDHTYHHAFLFPSEIRADRPYISEPDANGQFVINYERSDYDDTEADYVQVHFILPMENPWFDGSVYVLGDAWYNLFTSSNRMQYDNDHHAYVLTSYLKQGGYEWLYAFVPKGEKVATMQRIEGSFWQTHNHYRVYVYHRPFGSRYDRLIGLFEQ
ncbi:MAG: DUF5103 domain-containing protein [Paludibacteraceae bacterium]|nr:DUF5103 domain-containing protein [Paludibacteraceae bacterium]